MKFTSEQLEELIDGSEGFDYSIWRWGVHETRVFEYEGKHYMVRLTRTFDDGIQWLDEYDAVEVVEKEALHKVWVPV